jgi:hypothetical protein
LSDSDTAHLLKTWIVDHSTASRVLSVVYATKAITKIIYDPVLSVVYATKAITKIIYRIALGRSRRRAQLRIVRGMPSLPEISINCDHHHGIIRLGSHYLYHGWGQSEFKAFVPELW